MLRATEMWFSSGHVRPPVASVTYSHVQVLGVMLGIWSYLVYALFYYKCGKYQIITVFLQMPSQPKQQVHSLCATRGKLTDSLLKGMIEKVRKLRGRTCFCS